MNIDTIDNELIFKHKECTDNKPALKENGVCGCFCCCNVFDYDSINEWIDDKLTALCPRCGVDSVLPTDDKNLLVRMEKHWFDLAEHE